MTNQALIPYVRRSRGDEDKISIADQKAQIKQWAERTGATLLPFVEEPLGTSGATSWRERQVGDVLRRLEAGEAEGVVVAYFSRLTRERQSATWEILEELVPHRLVAVREGIDSPAGDEPDWNQAIQGFQANAEWRTLRRHLKSGKHDAWTRGVMSGPAPAGYDSPVAEVRRGREVRGPLVKNEHAPAIKRAFEMRADGHGWVAVARHLTQSGVETFWNRRGERPLRPWSPQATRALIGNDVYMGRWTCGCGCGGSEVRPDLAVVTRATWEAAQPMRLADLPEGRKRESRSTALLAGLLTCSGCGYTLASHHTHHGDKTYRSYRCTGNERCTSRVAVSARAVEPFVVEAALDYWLATDPQSGSPADPELLTRLEVERDAAAAEVEAFVVNTPASLPGYSQGLATRQAALEAADDALAAERSKRNREAIDADEARRAAMAALADESATEDRDALKRMLKRMVDTVVVAKATGRQGQQPVAERLDVRFRAILGQAAA